MSKRKPGVVSVVLVNFRGTDDTISAVRGLTELDWPQDRLEIVVVENGSGDDSMARLKAAFGGSVVLVESKKNLGFAGGSNLGVAKSSGEYVAFLNNDARPDSRWIAEAVKVFQSGADVGAVASKVLDWEGEEVDYVGSAITWFGMGYKPHAGERDGGRWDDPRDVLFGTGAAMFVRAEVFEALKGFDERYFMFYEDVDLGWRLNLLGYRFAYAPTSLAFHKHHASMEKFGDFHELYLLERNALFTLYKNLEDEQLKHWLAAALMLVVRRATGRGNVEDTDKFDLRKSGADKAPEETVSRRMLAGFYAIDRLVEELPGLDGARAEIQTSRQRSDRQLLGLFGNIDEPAYPIDSYLEGYRSIVSSLGVLDQHVRRRILIITGDPVGARMAGPAIRAWNMARILSKDNDVRLVSMNSAVHRGEPFEIAEVSYHRPSSMNPHVGWADVIITQGHALSLFPALEKSGKYLIVDIYDPMHLEQLEQGREKPLSQWTKQVEEANESLNHQLEVGDFFLCASERQRSFWLGQLASLGRVNPFTYGQDNDLEGLLSVVPFGIPSDEPTHTRAVLRDVVPGIGADDKVIIWGGGIYNWFDPETLIHAVARLAERHSDVRLFFLGTQHPNPHVPEMRAAIAARELAEELGLTGTHVFFNDTWVAYEERQNYLLEADLGVSTHFQHIETTYSFRTRILDYLWAGLPIVTTGGDSFGDLVEARELGASVAERDIAALETALETYLYEPEAVATARANVAEARRAFEWERVLAPVVEFCVKPHRAPDKKPEPVEAVKAGKTVAVRARVPQYSGLRRDLGRAVYYLRNGGARVVVGKVRARITRRNAGQ
ncbi:glycosyltransferase [Gryllotalpicola koreensis]|uniref:Glycosyltransferase n=1 Tax=Gryllotalpicola koreensis TaxID=993086 RepID=A0ABP8A1R8_9MICO